MALPTSTAVHGRLWNEIHRRLQRQSDFNFDCLHYFRFGYWNGNGVDGVSKLISGKEALIALANGEDVEFSVGNSGWHDFGGSKVFCPNVIMCGINQNGEALNFRLKPRTIKIGEFEVPAPFEPEEDCTVYIIDDGKDDGYVIFDYEFCTHDSCNFIGMWRTKEEIKQVVLALRSVFNWK